LIPGGSQGKTYFPTGLKLKCVGWETWRTLKDAPGMAAGQPAAPEPGELDAVRPYYRNVDAVADLPRGQFLAYNRESGAELAGRLF